MTDLAGAVELVARAVQTRMAGARRDAARNNLGTKLTDEMVRDAAESATVGGLPVLALCAILDALASITQERDEARETWAWLAKNTNLELDHRYEDEDDDGGTWRVHRVNGGVNDREWTLVSKGRTPLEAVQRAATPTQEDS